MTRADEIRSCLQRVVDMASDEQLAQWLLSFSRSDLIDAGELYSLWCDNQGACMGRNCEEIDDCCSDAEHIACIMRFLSGECTLNS